MIKHKLRNLEFGMKYNRYNMVDKINKESLNIFKNQSDYLSNEDIDYLRYTFEVETRLKYGDPVPENLLYLIEKYHGKT